MPPGIIHHSDRGVQYCARAYVERLQNYGFQISMSRAGNPYDNALAESFMRTLKCEEVYLAEYRDEADAREKIGRFLEEYYNRRRLHSSLNYRSPEQFETTEGVSMSFSRHPEIYQSDGWVGGPGLLPLARPPHRLDEFPASYSLAGCSPAEPASASPTDASMNESVRRDKHSSANGNVSLVLLSQPWGPLHLVPSEARGHGYLSPCHYRCAWTVLLPM